MGIYLSNIEMPKDRGMYIAIDIDGQVYAKPLGAIEWKRLDQKAVPVPPHGRTIDADALYAAMKKERDRIAKDYGDDDPFVRCLTKYAMSMVLSAPTIIEAEGE